MRMLWLAEAGFPFRPGRELEKAERSIALLGDFTAVSGSHALLCQVASCQTTNGVYKKSLVSLLVWGAHIIEGGNDRFVCANVPFRKPAIYHGCFLAHRSDKSEDRLIDQP